MIIVYGSASSGKSNIAENMALSHSRENGTGLYYIATMENESAASKERIRKHRKQREGKGFYTIEEMYRLSAHAFSVRGKTALLECVSNLCANIYYRDFSDGVASDEDIEGMKDFIVSSIVKMAEGTAEMFIVSNDIFRDGIIYDEWTESYLKLLSEVNKSLANICDAFYEVIDGVAVRIK